MKLPEGDVPLNCWEMYRHGDNKALSGICQKRENFTEGAPRYSSIMFKDVSYVANLVRLGNEVSHLCRHADCCRPEHLHMKAILRIWRGRLITTAFVSVKLQSPTVGLSGVFAGRVIVTSDC